MKPTPLHLTLTRRLLVKVAPPVFRPVPRPRGACLLTKPPRSDAVLHFLPSAGGEKGTRSA